MSVLRYYGCTDLCNRTSDPWLVILYLISDLCLVLCCDIYRSTLISIMYPACMITVHDRKSRALQTSLVNIMGPQSIFTPLFTPSIYFQLPLLSLALLLCKQQGRR